MHIPQQVTREQLKGSYSEGEALAIYNEVKKTGQWLSFLKTFLDVFYPELMDELRRSLESMDRAYHQKKYHFVRSLWGMLIGLIPCLLGAALYALFK